MTDAPTEREGESTWTRLRHRKVVQWGLAYGATQMLSLVHQTLGTPEPFATGFLGFARPCLRSRIGSNKGAQGT